MLYYDCTPIVVLLMGGCSLPKLFVGEKVTPFSRESLPIGKGSFLTFFSDLRYTIFKSWFLMVISNPSLPSKFFILSAADSTNFLICTFY